MVSKTKTGIEPFDREFGGTYQGRVTLLSGPSKTGKTAIALQFVNAGLELGENVLMLSAMPSRDLAILAESLNMSVDTHVESGELTILEYNDFVPGRDAEENIMLPPEGFSQLQAVIENSGINRIAIDTVVPWIAFPGNRHMAEHIFSFVRAFERLGATTLFTAPKPASAAAQRMMKYIFDNVPVAIHLSRSTDNSELNWRTSKYLGETNADCSFKYKVEKGVGVVEASKASSPAGATRRAAGELPGKELGTPFSAGVYSEVRGSQSSASGGLGGRRASGSVGKSAFSNVVWKDGTQT